MTEPGRGPRRVVRSRAQLVFGILVLLAVAGSAVMVFSDRAQLLRLAVVALLWVAVICSIAVTKYRKDAATSASRVRELQRVYELELAREVAARKEHELVVEKDLRQQVHSQLRAESNGDIAALRAEVQALRESLSGLFEGDFLVERVALRAESTRVRALPEPAPAVVAAVAPAPEALAAGGDRQVVDAETEELEIVAVEPAEDDPGAHSAGRSVAELLAAYGGGSISSRRRRRALD